MSITKGELEKALLRLSSEVEDEAEVIIKGKGPQVVRVYTEQTSVWCGERDGVQTTQRVVIIGEN
jgi:hypothetical protein